MKKDRGQKMSNVNRDKPLHSGEIYHLWAYLYDAKMNILTLQVYMNHSEEDDFKNYLEDLFENCYEEEVEQIEKLLKELGIRLPPQPPDRPHVEVRDIPAGARLHDAEMALLIKKELIYGRLLCSFIIGCAFQDFIRSIFENFHTERVAYEQKLITLIEDKGWFVSPPISVKS